MGWDAAAWSGSSDKDLNHWLKKHLAEAHATANCFTLMGAPIKKDAVLTHWGNLPNFFNEGEGDRPIKSKSQLDKVLQQLGKKGGQDIPIFFFDKIVMHDDDDEEHWEVGLGSHVLIDEPKYDADGKLESDYYIARITHIAFTAAGDRKIGVQWLYRIQDTPLAVDVKLAKEQLAHIKKVALEDGNEAPSLQRVLPVAGDVFPRGRVWLCGSDADNRRYNYVYDVDNIDKPVQVYKVPPGIAAVEEVQAVFPGFDADKDYFYNGHTQQDFYTFEDLHIDVTPWSEGYKKVLAAHGLEGIRLLRGTLSKAQPEGGFKRLMSLSRGTTADAALAPLLECVQEAEPSNLTAAATGAGADSAAMDSDSDSDGDDDVAADQRGGGAGPSSNSSSSHASKVKLMAEKIQGIRQRAEAEAGARRVMRKLELFCGGGGLSYLAQADKDVQIVSCWANDINPSACSTYVCNKPHSLVSCCGLEELSQLHRHWFDLVQLLLGEGWVDLPEMRPLILLPPGKRYSRKHMPEGIGCGGGLDPNEAWHAVYPARKGQEAREALRPLLLSLAGMNHQQVRTFLEKRKAATDPSDTTPISDHQVEALMQQAQHYKRYAAQRAAAEAALPKPDFEACLAALPHVQLPADDLSGVSLGGGGGGGSRQPPASKTGGGSKGGQQQLQEDSKGKSTKGGKDSKGSKGIQKQQDSKDEPQDSLKKGGGSKKGGGKGKAGQAAAAELQVPPKVAEHATRLLSKLLPRVAPQSKLDAARGSEAQQGSGQSDKDRPEQRYKESYDQQHAAVVRCLMARLERKLGEVVEVRDVRVRDCARRCDSGNNKKQTATALAGFECWLEFDVKRQGSDVWRWEHQALLHTRGAMTPMRRFMLAMIADKTIPLPGDVDVMTGGPPCQNMSGLNRQARQEDVMSDPKNRLVAAYMGTIEFLRPGYLLIEQVTDIYKKEEALYARFSIFTMLQHGYQARAGILTAGFYGTPEGRLRAIFWGAMSGTEQLPPFPAATHQCKDHGIGYPAVAKHSQVRALPEDQEGVKPLYPFHVWGDVTSDLPPVENYSELERLQYAKDPQTFLQQWLRRAPPADEHPLLMRAVHADAAMSAWAPTHSKARAAAIIDHSDPDWKSKVMAAGMSALCNTCMWLTGLKTDQVLKIAAETRSQNAKAAAALAAAEAAAGGSGDAAAAEEDAEGGGAAVGEDEEEQQEAEDLAQAMKGEDRFMPQVQRKLIEESSKGDPRRALMVAWNAQANQHAVVAHTGLKRVREMHKAQAPLDVLTTLRDHRPHTCNIDDWLRMVSLPKQPGVCFRDLQGVVTNPDKTCCAGCWHACGVPATPEDKKLLADNVAKFKRLPQQQQQALDPMEYVFRGVKLTSACSGGGAPPKPPAKLFAKTGNDKKYRVDCYGVRPDGTSKPGCLSRTLFLGSNGLLCPRWCVTYNNGKSIGRNGCFGRISPEIVQPTVVTRPEPHNLQLVHHEEDRVLTVREDARCQAFPDHHVFIGLNAGAKSGSGKGLRIVAERYLQIGNAVAPPMASALGRCLLQAAAKKAPVAEPVIYTADPDFVAAVEEGTKAGCVFYSKANNVSQKLPDNWARYPQVGSDKRRGAASNKTGAGTASKCTGTAAGGGGGDADGGCGSMDVDVSAEATAGDGGEGGVSEVPPAPKRQKKAGGGAAAAGGGGGGAGSSKGGSKKKKKKQQPDADAGAAAAGAGAGASGSGGSPAAAATKKSKKNKRKQEAAADGDEEDVGEGEEVVSPKKKHRKQQGAPTAAAAAGPAASGDEADVTPDGDQAGARSTPAGSRKAGGGGGGSGKRPVRGAAAATAAAIRESLRRDNAPPF